jgi:hypothetical protein
MLQVILVVLTIFLSQSLHAQSVANPAGGGTLPLDETEAADGTLPLRLPGDGTLPLKLSGDATAAGARVNTSVSITSVEQRALPLQQRASLLCQIASADVSKHAASGNVVVSGVNYSIKGICYDHVSKNMEIVATKGSSETSFMIGKLGSAELTAFSGKLIVNGSTSTSYQFAVKTQ